jgi:MarR family transcriptional regulator, organic hydroperoxide resistance regulator
MDLWRLMSSKSPASQHRIYHALQLAAHRLQRHADRVLLRVATITTGQAAVLSIIHAQGQGNQRDLARQLSVSEAAMATMVARLSKLSMIERVRDASDMRSWKLTVSKSGIEALALISEPFGAINSALDATFTAAEIAALSNGLARISGLFDLD